MTWFPAVGEVVRCGERVGIVVKVIGSDSMERNGAIYVSSGCVIVDFDEGVPSSLVVDSGNATRVLVPVEAPPP